MNNKFAPGTPAFGMLCAAIGMIAALALLFLGFWRMLLVAAFAAAGYFIGAVPDKINFIKSRINKLFPPKGE